MGTVLPAREPPGGPAQWDVARRGAEVQSVRASPRLLAGVSGGEKLDCAGATVLAQAGGAPAAAETGKPRSSSRSVSREQPCLRLQRPCCLRLRS